MTGAPDAHTCPVRLVQTGDFATLVQASRVATDRELSCKIRASCKISITFSNRISRTPPTHVREKGPRAIGTAVIQSELQSFIMRFRIGQPTGANAMDANFALL